MQIKFKPFNQSQFDFHTLSFWKIPFGKKADCAFFCNKTGLFALMKYFSDNTKTHIQSC